MMFRSYHNAQVNQVTQEGTFDKLLDAFENYKNSSSPSKDGSKAQYYGQYLKLHRSLISKEIIDKDAEILAEEAFQNAFDVSREALKEYFNQRFLPVSSTTSNYLSTLFTAKQRPPCRERSTTIHSYSYSDSEEEKDEINCRYSTPS